jgi:hypothetical protein
MAKGKQRKVASPTEPNTTLAVGTSIPHQSKHGAKKQTISSFNQQQTK